MPRHHYNHWLHDKLYIVGKHCLEKTTTSCDMHAWKQYNKPAHCDNVYLTGFAKRWLKVAAEIVKTGKLPVTRHFTPFKMDAKKLRENRENLVSNLESR